MMNREPTAGAKMIFPHHMTLSAGMCHRDSRTRLGLAAPERGPAGYSLAQGSAGPLRHISNSPMPGSYQWQCHWVAFPSPGWQRRGILPRWPRWGWRVGSAAGWWRSPLRAPLWGTVWWSRWWSRACHQASEYIAHEALERERSLTVSIFWVKLGEGELISIIAWGHLVSH